MEVCKRQVGENDECRYTPFEQVWWQIGGEFVVDVNPRTLSKGPYRSNAINTGKLKND